MAGTRGSVDAFPLTLLFRRQRRSESWCSYSLCKWRVFFLPLSQHWKSLCELVLPAGNSVLSQQGNNNKWRNHKEAKVGLERTYHSLATRDTSLQVFCLLYFFAARRGIIWGKVPLSWPVRSLTSGIHVKLGLFGSGICWRPVRRFRYQQSDRYVFFCCDLLNLENNDLLFQGRW